MSNVIKMELGYNGTNFKRNVNISGVKDTDLTTVKTKIKALNASIAGGTSDGLDTFLVSDDYDANASIGAFTGVTAAKIVSTTTEYIDLGEEEEEEEGE